MSKFKVGDRVRYILYVPSGFTANEYAISHNNMECIITKSGVNLRHGNQVYKYKILFDDGESFCCLENELEPLQKRPELGTIEELKMITGGWTPGHVTKRKVNS